MSGPIVRKYGFPNFEQIFGKRELQHGVDESEEQTAPSTSGPETTTDAPKAPTKRTSARARGRKSG